MRFLRFRVTAAGFVYPPSIIRCAALFLEGEQRCRPAADPNAWALSWLAITALSSESEDAWPLLDGALELLAGHNP